MPLKTESTALQLLIKCRPPPGNVSEKLGFFLFPEYDPDLSTSVTGQALPTDKFS